MIDVQELQFAYSQKQVLQDVSLHLEKGDFCAIVGPNGSGKTTLTEMLAKHFGWIANYEKVDNNPYLSGCGNFVSKNRI